MVDKRLFKSVMARFGDRQQDLAKAIGISQQSLSFKVNNLVQFKPSEIELIAIRYSLTADEIQRIFFANTVNREATEVKAEVT